jgi:ABC-2 type transport system ATP-binding protein
VAGAAIEVRGLKVVRGGKPVLQGLDLDVREGCVTGLLGPSGSGKTTLIRSIVGVQVVAGGHVDVLGSPAGAPALRRHIGYVTQAPSVYGDLTVEENLVYFARLTSTGRDRVPEVLAEVDLREQAGQLVRTLSDGQHARVSLASALLSRPRVLVLDEPTVGLDPVLRRDLWALFHDLAATGATLLVSSHVMDEAANCDRLVLLRDGTVIFTGTPDELRRAGGTFELDAAFLRLIEQRAAS